MYGESQYYTPYEQDVPYGQAHNMPPPQPMQQMQGMSQQQQPYGMGQNTPQPMGLMPANQQGFPNMGSPFTNNSMSPQNFAKGGSVTSKNLKMAVEALRKQGDGRDQILAHINPEEAMELAQRHGGDINQRTGLPQFGWWERMWDGIFEGGHKVVDKVGLPVSNFLGKTLATAAGTMLGGPLGGVLGGTLAGGALEGHQENPNYGRGLLGGAMHGGLQAFGGPMLGRALGVSAGGTAGTLMGMSAPKLGMLGSSLGLGLGASNAAGAAAGRSAAYSRLANVGKAAGAPAAGGGGGGILSSIFGGGGSDTGAGGGLLGGGLLDKALLATALLGTMGAKKEVPKEPSMQDMINNGPKWGPEHQPRDIKPISRELKHFDSDNYTPGFKPEQLYYNEVNPVAKYASGGHVFQGAQSGQADNLDEHLPAGGYVIDASTIGDLGDGNTQAGANQIRALATLGSGRNYKKGGTPKGFVPAKVSAGEAYIEPETVTAIGKGDNSKGAKRLEKMVNNVRKHKRSSSKGLPPKAKNIKAYLGSK